MLKKESASLGPICKQKKQSDADDRYVNIKHTYL